MRLLTFLLGLAFLFMSCDSVLSPESGTNQEQSLQTSSSLFPQVLQSLSQGNWEAQESRTDANLIDVHFVDEQNGWVVGGAVLRTTDGGQTWEEVEELGDGQAVDFVDPLHGWILSRPNIFRTTDGGDTWTTFEAPGLPIADIAFTDSQTGYTVAQIGWEGRVHHTNDGGQTWEELKRRGGRVGGFTSISFRDANSGTAVGSFGNRNPDRPMYVTINEDWSSTVGNSNSNQPLGVSHAGDDWVAVGTNGSIVRSGDSVSSGTEFDLWGVSFANDKTGFTVGVSGTILNSIDGGQTWQSQDSGTSEDLRAVHAVDTPEGHRAWAVGNNGTILHYSGEELNPAPQPEPEILSIYEDGLEEPWINASWNASVDFNSNEHAHTHIDDSY
jgi:photosystem II stability/assembly factor-like uncharacterized protein